MYRELSELHEIEKSERNLGHRDIANLSMGILQNKKDKIRYRAESRLPKRNSEYPCFGRSIYSLISHDAQVLE